MADDIAKRDSNRVTTLLGITDDASADIKRLLVDATTGRLKVTAVITGGMITSINTLTAAAQTLAVGTAGTDFAISSATATHTFNLPDASTTNRGALTSTDWDTFNAKGNVSKVGTPADSQVGVWTGDGTIEGTAGLTYDGSNLLLTGDIGITGTRITKGWFTDLQVTNAIAGSITGNAATVSTITGLAPDTATTQATQAAITTCANLVTVGTIGTGVWQGTDVGPEHGGTGVSNGANNTVTFTGNFTLRLTLSANTAVTLPTSGTLVNTAVATLSSLTSIGTIATGVWEATDVAIAHGGTGASTLAGASIPTYTSTITFTNKRITPRVTTEASSATPTINTDNSDAHSITALAAAITSMTTNLSGTPTNFQKLIVRFKDNGTARAITWGASFESKGVTLPTTTTISKVLTVGLIYDTVTSKWGCVAVADEE